MLVIDKIILLTNAYQNLLCAKDALDACEENYDNHDAKTHIKVSMKDIQERLVKLDAENQQKTVSDLPIPKKTPIGGLG